MKPTERRYIVRKYVMAKSVLEVIEKERNLMADDVFLDEQWLKENTKVESVGFKI